MEPEKEQIILDSLKYAYAVATKYAKVRGLLWCLDDLKSAASLALIESADNFDPRIGSFKTKFYKRLLGSISDEFAFVMGGYRSNYLNGDEEKWIFPTFLPSENLLTLPIFAEAVEKYCDIQKASRKLTRKQQNAFLGILAHESQVALALKANRTPGAINLLLRDAKKKLKRMLGN